MNNKTLKRIIEARFRIVTPMFLGGADLQADDIRPASVKGMLRFWWRALQWQHFHEYKPNKTDVLKEMHKKEEELFGSAVDRGKGGQGIFLLKVQHPNLTTENNRFSNSSGVAYLAGQGLKHRRNLAANQKFYLQLLFHPNAKIEDIQSIKDAMCLFGLLGGLGSRMRRGFGSVTLETLTSNGEILWKFPADCQQYKVEVLSLLSNNIHMPESPYSAFSKTSRIDVLLKSGLALEVLDQIGLRMLDYRSWGRSQNGNILPSGKQSEKRFREDHDWSKNPYSSRFYGFHPCRVVFGLPHNYKRLAITSERFERRASPLMLHVHQLNENEYVGVSVLLLSQFLPENERISLPSEQKNKTNYVKANVNYQYLHDFLDGFEGNPPRTDLRFPDRSPIFP